MNKRIPAIDQAENLYELLHNPAIALPTQLACAYLGDDGEIRTQLSFAQLELNAKALGARLQGLDAGGECAVLLYPPGLDFISAFFACIYANVIAIPLPLPRTKSNFAQTKAIIEQTNSHIVLSTGTSLTKLNRQDEDYFADLICLDTEEIDTALSTAWRKPAHSSPEDLAYLQYTSGSTSARKGVMISHANVIANIRGIDRGFQHRDGDVAVNWLPHFHDLGLVSGILQPLYHGITNYLMAPSALVQRPIRWLAAISKFRATHTNSPNYAYDLCISKITDEQMHGLDLTAWRIALNGAEPVRAETVRDFYKKFEPVGLAKTTMYPAYGLAEATLVVSAGLPNTAPQTLCVDSADLEKGLVSVDDGSTHTRQLVACGEALEDTLMAIVDPVSGSMARQGVVGEIWVSGPAIATGYWQNDEATRETFEAVLEQHLGKRFLRTGDLGFIHEQALYITGRQKDLIIIRGANHYPQDIEWTVEQSHPAFKAGCGAAFSVEVDDEEKLIVVYELEREFVKNFDRDEIVRAARRDIAQEHDLQLYGLMLLKTASVPRTSSGKIQRSQCRLEYLGGTLVQVGRWLQEDDLQSQPTVSAKEQKMTSDFQRRDDTSNNSSGSDQRDEICRWLRDYAERRLNTQSNDERRAIPPHVLLDFGNRGLLGLQAAGQYGGLGLSTLDALRVVEQIGAIDQTLAMMCIVHNTLGISPIERAATEQLKATLLPKLASGRELVAFAMTEPEAGSNPRAIVSRAVKVGDNKWLLNGQKSWSGTAGWASVINVFAHQIDSDGEPQGMVGFCVPISAAGVTIGPEAKTFGMRGMVQNTVYFNNVEVDGSRLLGEPGGGMAVAQHVMQRGRLMIAAACIGGMKRCVQLMVRYGSRRTISSGNLLENQFWTHRVAEICNEVSALECLVSIVAAREDAQQAIPPDVFAALKITAPEFFWRAADSLVQMLGGRGYIDTNIAPQLLRDARVARILEGPTEALQMFLGARVTKDSVDFHQFVNSLSEAGKIDRQGQAPNDMSTIVKRTLEGHEHGSGLDHRYLCAVGDMAAQAILTGCVKASQHKNNDPQLTQSGAWADAKLGSMAEALATFDDSPGELTVQQLMTNVEAYRLSIGDVEEQLAGFDENLDPLLKRNTIASPTKAKTPNPSSVQTKENDNHLPLALSKYVSPPINTNIDSSGLAEFMSNWLEAELKLPSGTVQPQHTFFEHGVDSVVSVMLTVAIEDEYGYLVEPEMIYDYQRIQSCAEAISKLLAKNGKLNTLD